ncbi:hypothetical protein CRT22_23960 [Escherichia sp. E5028]|nr:hypothetical protein CRT22_23960 [Escherichia sp. E5028]
MRYSVKELSINLVLILFVLVMWFAISKVVDDYLYMDERIDDNCEECECHVKNKNYNADSIPEKNETGSGACVK